MAAGLALVAAIVVLFVIDVHLSGRPAVSAKDVNGTVGAKIKSAVTKLQAQPAPGSRVYQAALAGVVVVQAQNTAASTTSLGTGIVVDTSGEILTALHVVQGGSDIQVTFADGTTSPATVASSDPGDDIAVLAPVTLPSVLQPEVLGGGAQVGDQAFVIGNPLGLAASLSAGVVSGLDRSFTLPGGNTMSGMIQFDAAVNPGNSGGPLLNAKGQVIGIVTGLVNPSGADAFAGIGFAVPISTAGGAAGAPPK